MNTYYILVITTIFVGFAAVEFIRNANPRDRKAFLTAALANAAAILAILFWPKRRRP